MLAPTSTVSAAWLITSWPARPLSWERAPSRSWPIICIRHRPRRRNEERCRTISKASFCLVSPRLPLTGRRVPRRYRDRSNNAEMPRPGPKPTPERGGHAGWKRRRPSPKKKAAPPKHRSARSCATSNAGGGEKNPPDECLLNVTCAVRRLALSLRVRSHEGAGAAQGARRSLRSDCRAVPRWLGCAEEVLHAGYLGHLRLSEV